MPGAKSGSGCAATAWRATVLTRLQVSGFKNLVDADVRFGPFTCVVGPNGAGKSNLFDAIRFLSALADGPLHEAVAAVGRRHRHGRQIRELFHRAGDSYADRMTLVAVMAVPGRAVDDPGRRPGPVIPSCATRCNSPAVNGKAEGWLRPSP